MESTRRSIGSGIAPLRTLALGVLTVLFVAAAPAVAGARVLRVGTFHGINGNFKWIQGAVDAAQEGDWILIGPGDHHPRADFSQLHHAPADGSGAGVLITTNRLHVRGMDRNGVIIDGTRPSGSAPCSSNPADQSYGPKGQNGQPVGRNGIVIYKASGVSIENLTACNFLGEGNQIWWNGGDGSGTIGMGAWYGNYLSATTTFYQSDKPQASYGEFASNARGPGRLAHSYASNMNDAGVYIGACQQVCHSVVTDSHFAFNALGYSGTNAGGQLVLKNSEWDHNASGIVTNSQNNDDAPSPQDGACPNGGTGPTGTYSCTFIENNNVHDNNNNHTPLTTPSPFGSGIVIAGGRDDTVMGNTVTHHGAWGILTVPYPDLGPPPPVAHCEGGIANALGPGSCLYDDWGNQIHHNVLSLNGFYGNPTNGDLAEDSNPEPTENSNCWYANKHPNGDPATADPSNLQTTLHGKDQCGQPQTAGGDNTTLTAQAGCDARVLPCDPSMNYPTPGAVVIHKLPPQASMPNPCAGVPANPWCPSTTSGSRRH
jgi:hypothetical protein